MTQPHLLIVTYHFPPSAASGAFRMLGFARHLPRFGWRTTVVAPPTLPWEPVDHDLAARVPEATRVVAVPYPRNKVARRLAPMACWLPRALAACRRAVERQPFDAVLTSGPPHLVHYLGLALKQRYGTTWLADFRDPWYPVGRLERGTGPGSRLIAAQERCVLQGADLVIANAPAACQQFRDAYPHLEPKFVTVPNGYDREAFENLPPRPRLPREPIHVVHTGAIYCGRDPRPFLQAMRMLAESRPCPGPRASFFGPPPETPFDFAAELRALGLAESVTMHGQVPYVRCLREMVDADVLLLMDTPGRTVGVPAKLYEYIGAGRPILALGERGGDLEWVLQRSAVPFRIAPPDNPAQIAAALADLGRASCRFAGAEAGSAHAFSRETLAGRLAGHLDALLLPNRRPAATVAVPLGGC